MSAKVTVTPADVAIENLGLLVLNNVPGRVISVAYLPDKTDPMRIYFGASIFRDTKDAKDCAGGAGGSCKPDDADRSFELFDGRRVTERTVFTIQDLKVILQNKFALPKGVAESACGTSVDTEPPHCTREQLRAIEGTAIRRLRVRPCVLLLPSVLMAPIQGKYALDMASPFVVRAVFEWVFSNRLPTEGPERLASPLFKDDDVQAELQRRRERAAVRRLAAKAGTAGAPALVRVPRGTRKEMMDACTKDVEKAFYGVHRDFKPRVLYNNKSEGSSCTGVASFGSGAREAVKA